MHPRSRLSQWLCLLLLAAAVAGCRMQTEPLPAGRRPSVQVDPCADRLHELCGRLLQYHSRHGQLPESLDELPASLSHGDTPAVCPRSGLPYTYRRRGVVVPDQSGVVIVYDSTPCHSGMRWGVLVDDLGSRTASTARVVLLPDRALQSALDAASAEEHPR